MGVALGRWPTAVAGCAVAVAVLVGGAGVAAADGGPEEGSTAAPLSDEQVRRLCDVRLPAVRARLSRLVERVSGGPDTVGSVQWLRARAARAQRQGRDHAADRLDRRADRREERLADLRAAEQQLAGIGQRYCDGDGG